MHLLDETLEEFLRAEVPLSARQVDVSFEAPDSEWGAGVTKPTVNLFLWDIRVNGEESQAGTELVDGEDGKRFRQRPRPRVDCRYLVTAWTTEVQDEHQLLGAVLTTLLGHREIAAEHLQGAYAPVRPLPIIAVARRDGEESADLWSALGGQLKPGLDLVVTATVDLALRYEAGPPVERYEVGVADRTAPDRVSRTVAVGGGAGAAGLLVRSPRGKATTDEEGHFLVRAEEGDEITIEAEKPLRGKVRAKGAVDTAAERSK